jgi:hypothetical protein
MMHRYFGVYMGFFSQLFGSDSKNGSKNSPAAPSKSASNEIEDSAAAAMLAEIDIDTAIAAHENWKLRLNNVLKGTSTEQLSPEIVCLDDRCDLGKWLHGPGGQRLAQYQMYPILVARHKYFHVQASTVLALAQSGDMAEAQKTMSSTYEYGSRQTIILLKELQAQLLRKRR